MSSREQDKSDFDLERFVDLFDTAMSSDNPAVQRALKNLLMIAALVDSDTKPDTRVRGPLRRLVDDLQNLNRRISQLESINQPRTYSVPGTINTPWVTTHNTTGTPNWPPGTIIGGTAGSGTYTITATGPGPSSTAYDDQFTDVMKTVI